MKYLYLLIVACLIFDSMDLKAQTEKKQEKLFEEARSQFAARNYDEAIATCNKILSGDPGFVRAHLLLADVYNATDSARQEIIHLLKAAQLTSDTLIYFRLGEAFYATGNYSEALDYYNIYSRKKIIPEKRRFLLASKIASCRFAINSIENPVEFDPRNMGDKINTSGDEYWPVPSLDGKKLIFTRLNRDSGYAQEDFYVSELDSGIWGAAHPLENINTAENEGAQTLSADSKLLFFTACNRPDGFGSCDIYFSRFQNGKWTTPQNAGRPLNTGSWEAQPSLSSDNRFLYFSSNREGGKGKKDIWRAELTGFSESGMPIWKEPENLGSAVNTPGNEVSPFIHANNRNFYFASDGHVGMGGLDLFTGEISESGKVENVRNMGYPINTHKDDMGLTISSIGDTAYFSSAREADKGYDIFSFNLDRGLRPAPVSYVKAKITDKKTGLPVAASIDFADLSYRVPKTRVEQADENGEIMLCLPPARDYSFTISKPGYMFYSRSFRLKDKKTLVDPFILNVELEPIELGAEMNLYNIYFETDSFRILPASEPELERLTAFLAGNPGVKVEIQGHTDNTGTPQRNQVLSEKRAKSVVDYLTSKGIDLSRLTFKGYGETQPVASNDTEEGRAQNRRTTVKIAGK